MSEQLLLDDLSGKEFEDLMVEVFRNLGYENVRKTRGGSDEGRDILMEEGDVLYVVECKHRQSKATRPMVQKLHSAAVSYDSSRDYGDDVVAMFVTTNEFTGPAAEYAENVGVELVDGYDLRELADEVGLDVQNGKVEIVCEQTVAIPTQFTPKALTRVVAEGAGIERFDMSDVEIEEAAVSFVPLLFGEASVEETFETSVGVVHREDGRYASVLRADEHPPTVLSEPVVGTSPSVESLPDAEVLDDGFDSVSYGSFQRDREWYSDWVRSAMVDDATTEVTYTGDNNVEYEKVCRPSESSVDVRRLDAVYRPEVSLSVGLREREYDVSLVADGERGVSVMSESMTSCILCGVSEELLACPNCGGVVCGAHRSDELVAGDVVCHDCAVVESWWFEDEYFYSEANRERFEERWAQLSLVEKAKMRQDVVMKAVIGAVLLSVFLFVAVAP